ncbi:hypothetical protein ACIG3E_33045 [Streptomyces sp. NPDC053474]|uniref:hypothetical protein n=1 Tax=Streptomyces sp. NPDC053474 TaxID=3365704 RepID=UPI0037CD21F4
MPHRQADGGTGITMVTCTSCGLAWDRDMTPTGHGPNYAQAYGDGSPSLLDEELALLLLAEDIKERATAALAGRGPGIEGSEHRDFLLRKAAYLDRAARELELGWFTRTLDDTSVTRASQQARDAADEFLAFELRHRSGFALGRIGADAPGWCGVDGTRGYVRQEYLAWRQAEEDEADQDQVLPRRASAGELFDADGRPL